MEVYKRGKERMVKKEDGDVWDEDRSELKR
jgi:hypothetical protein